MKKPKLGQNFLIDEARAHAIVDALGDTPRHGDRDRRGTRRDYIDPCCALQAADRHGARSGAGCRTALPFSRPPQVEVVEADILEVDFAALLLPGESADVVGNLPYYITSPILLRLFAAGHGLLARAVLMMQREVADRLTPRPDAASMGCSPPLRR